MSGEDGSQVPTEEIPLIPLTGTGSERPVPEWVEVSQSLYRVFAFVDVCGFTSFTDRHGTHAAIEVLTRFRSAARDVTGRRGVRVLKWLGDGVMLVGVSPGPVIAAVAELLLRFRDDEFEIHAGVTGGTVLLFEGDDYIGRSVNLAARLCEAAGPSEILSYGLNDAVPDWVEIAGAVTVRAMGIGDIADVAQLRVADDAWATHATVAHHPSAHGDR
jgi:class 3 adenylate cyclase